MRQMDDIFIWRKFVPLIPFRKKGRMGNVFEGKNCFRQRKFKKLVKKDISSISIFQILLVVQYFLYEQKVLKTVPNYVITL